MAIQNQCSQIMVEGYSQIIVTMIKKLLNGVELSKVSPSWKFLNNMEMLKSLLQPNMVLIPSHVRRTTNKTTNKLVNIGVRGEDMDWEDNPLLNLDDTLLLECIDLAKREISSPDGATSMM